MATLTVTDFSCLKHAEFDLLPVNVIIGPQGSGKSVTTKLFYFFSDIIPGFLTYAERGDTLEEYKKLLARQFSIWFPPAAWGPGRFNISYVADSFSVRLLRRRKAGKVTEDVSIVFSDWFVDFYKKSDAIFNQYRDQNEIEEDRVASSTDNIDRTFRAREVLSTELQSILRGEFTSRQTFIPAGRAFFTSIGRLVAGFEQAGSLDPVTIKFARLFANIRDRSFRRSSLRNSRVGEEFLARRREFMSKLFGGELKVDGDAEYVETPDGRRIPVTALSSGQQELLPMWALLDYFSEIDAGSSAHRINVLRNSTREIVYIEEPEAHLFPSAQSMLMDFLIGVVASGRRQRNLVITTHSPYIMSKLNVYLKAGQLSRRKKRNQDINEIVPRECWLQHDEVSALSIVNGTLQNLLDDDGLIDGRYLDDISEEISRQFSELLQIESEIVGG